MTGAGASYVLDEVVVRWHQAAEAAECRHEVPATVDRLWLRYADWLSSDHPVEAVAFSERRRQLLRGEDGEDSPREAPYLWFESYTLRHAGLDDARAGRAVLQAQRILEKAYGEASPQAAAAHRRVAFFYSGTGRKPEALKSLDRAIRVAERAGKPGRDELWKALVAKETILQGQPGGEADRAKLRERAKALFEALTAEGWTSDTTVW